MMLRMEGVWYWLVKDAHGCDKVRTYSARMKTRAERMALRDGDKVLAGGWAPNEFGMAPGAPPVVNRFRAKGNQPFASAGRVVELSGNHDARRLANIMSRMSGLRCVPLERGNGPVALPAMCLESWPRVVGECSGCKGTGKRGNGCGHFNCTYCSGTGRDPAGPFPDTDAKPGACMVVHATGCDGEQCNPDKHEDEHALDLLSHVPILRGLEAAEYGLREARKAVLNTHMVSGASEYLAKDVAERRYTVVEAPTWPFLIGDGTDRPIWPDRWYGFCDGGGFYGAKYGYESAGLAMRAIWLLDQDVEVAINAPALLGSVACCVLTGKQYVDRVIAICSDGPTGLSTYGRWSS